MDNPHYRYEQEPELSSDLEWMLLSGQAPPEVLAEALLEAYYIPVYHLAFAVLDSPQAARPVVPDLFAAALENVYRYPAVGSMNVWLFRPAVEHLQREQPRSKLQSVWRQVRGLGPSDNHSGKAAPRDKAEAALWECVDKLPISARWMLILTRVLDWSGQEAAQTLGLDPQQAEGDLSLARARCTASQIWENARAWGMQTSEVTAQPEDWLRSSLLRRWPTPQGLSETERIALAAQIARRAERSTRGSQRVGLIKEVTALAVVMGLVGGVLWGANRLYPDLLESAPLPTQTQKPLLSTRTPTPTPTPARPYYTDQFPMGVFYTILPGDTWELAALRIGTSTEELLRLNRIPAGAPPQIGQRLLIPGQLIPAATPQQVPPAASSFFPSPLPPLTRDSSYEDVLERIGAFMVQERTIWFDYRVHVSSPPGVIAPPTTYRGQLWLVNEGPYRIGILAGREGEMLTAMIWGEEVLFTEPLSSSPWFRKFQDLEPVPGIAAPVRMVTFLSPPYNLQLSDCMKIYRNRLEYGDSTLAFSCRNEKKEEEFLVWFEMVSGRPLKQQYWMGSELALDVEYIGYETNFPYPYELFDPWLPWRGGYAKNAAGDPLPYDTPLPTPQPQQPTLAPLAPLAGFDPRQFELTIQYPDPPDWTEALGISQGQPAQLFAGPYLLLETNFPEPYSLVCQRSPTGDMLVFAYGSPFFTINYFPDVQNIQWINLRKPQEVQELGPEITASSFAFSADGRYLALALYGNNPNLSILELDTGILEHLANQQNMKHLAWSPDGKFLAGVTDLEYVGPTDLVVYEVETKAQVYKQKVSQQDGGEFTIPADAPIWDWGITYPPERPGGRVCGP